MNALARCLDLLPIFNSSIDSGNVTGYSRQFRAAVSPPEQPGESLNSVRFRQSSIVPSSDAGCFPQVPQVACKHHVDVQPRLELHRKPSEQPLSGAKGKGLQMVCLVPEDLNEGRKV